MHNFKIACANLKDPNISSLRMNHFKIAHISTWLATIIPNCVQWNSVYSWRCVCAGGGGGVGRGLEMRAISYLQFIIRQAMGQFNPFWTREFVLSYALEVRF